MKKIVVIGATGKVGSKVSNLLLDKGYQPTLIARNIDNLIPFEKRGAKILAISVFEVEKLTLALKDADIVLTMIVSNPVPEEFIEDQRQQAYSQLEAIKRSGIKNVLNLSSNGCHVIEGNGVIQVLTEFEVMLNQLKGVNVLNLRPTFYMDNLLYFIGLVKHKGILALPIDANIKFPMIPTIDVANLIVKHLEHFDIESKKVLPYLGYSDYSLNDVVESISKALDKKVPYITITPEEFIQGLIASGIAKQEYADKFAELMVATSNGLLNTHKRNPENTTSTTLEEFITTEFLKAYNN